MSDCRECDQWKAASYGWMERTHEALDEINRLTEEIERLREALDIASREAYQTGYDDGWNVACSDDDRFLPDKSMERYIKDGVFMTDARRTLAETEADDGQ